MKKLISLVIVLAMCLCLAACGKQPEAPAPTPEADSDIVETLPETPAETPDDSPAEGMTMGQTLLADFNAQLAADPAAGAQQLADTLLTNSVIEFGGASMAVEPGFLTGFGNEEITGFKEAVMFGPVIGSIPFIGYIFVLEDGADVTAFTDKLSADANPAWNICVVAEETVIEANGNYVFFLMCPGPNA